MSDSHPHQPDPGDEHMEDMSTPIGIARDLEAMADGIDGSTAPDVPEGEEVEIPGQAPPTHGPE